jgi:hypothetical protein
MMGEHIPVNALRRPEFESLSAEGPGWPVLRVSGKPEHVLISF